jgi:hypothetical protein
MDSFVAGMGPCKPFLCAPQRILFSSKYSRKYLEFFKNRVERAKKALKNISRQSFN